MRKIKLLMNKVGGALQAEKIAPLVYIPSGNIKATLSASSNIFFLFSLHQTWFELIHQFCILLSVIVSSEIE